MYSFLKNVHSGWAYLVILVLVLAFVASFIARISNKPYSAIHFRLALFGLITTHLQLLIGFVLYFVSPYFENWSSGMGGVMKNSEIRLYIVEHPLTMIIAVVLITIGYSKHKKALTSKSKLMRIALFYGIGLVLLLSRIPWKTWLNAN
ncbi:MAG: hypothetical protein RQ756_03760 [Flavobacteriaceae bacterium]|nr:hypothetical protein [Flavobacteriaceae bacterium]